MFVQTIRQTSLFRSENDEKPFARFRVDDDGVKLEVPEAMTEEESSAVGSALVEAFPPPRKAPAPSATPVV